MQGLEVGVSGCVEKVWKEFRDCLVDGANEVCGRTKGPPRHKESWWWNDKVAAAVGEKRRMYLKMKESKKGDDKQRAQEDSLAYGRSKNECKKVIGKAKEAERMNLAESLETEDGKGKLFRAVKQMVNVNKDVAGGGCLKGKDGKIVVDEEKIKEIWRSYFEKVSNEEFTWDRNALDAANTVSGPIEEITCQEVKLAIEKMKNGKAAGPSGVVAEMLKAAGDIGIQWM